MQIAKLVMGGNNKAGKWVAFTRDGKEVTSIGKGNEVASAGRKGQRYRLRQKGESAKAGYQQPPEEG